MATARFGRKTVRNAGSTVGAFNVLIGQLNPSTPKPKKLTKSERKSERGRAIVKSIQFEGKLTVFDTHGRKVARVTAKQLRKGLKKR